MEEYVRLEGMTCTISNIMMVDLGTATISLRQKAVLV